MTELSNFDWQYVSNNAISRAEELIELFDLHKKPDEPINISPLLDKFDLQFMELPPTSWGFTLDMGNKIIIGLNDKLSREATRYTVAHELGHVACWHPNQLHSCVQGEWAYDQLETEATTIAAYLLVPRFAIANPIFPSLEAIGKYYVIPPELAFIRQLLYIRTAH